MSQDERAPNRFIAGMTIIAHGIRVMFDVPSASDVNHAMNMINKSFSGFASEVDLDRDSYVIVIDRLVDRVTALEHQCGISVEPDDKEIAAAKRLGITE